MKYGGMNIEKLIATAQAYDYEHRQPGANWSRVPDSQVLRLLIGAGLVKPEKIAS